MMLYLTGASSSSKSNEAPQDDVTKSLGGYISSTPVPNALVNSLFDLISLRTLKEHIKETIAIGLVNKFDTAVSDVNLKIVGSQDNLCLFKIAAVKADENHLMEHINNRYSEPINADFYDATFFKGSVDVEILYPGVEGEEIVFDPFDVTAEIKQSGIEGTYDAISKAFSNSEYKVERLTERMFRIERQDDITIETPFSCSFISTEGAKFEFKDKFRNVKCGEVNLIDKLEPNEAIGIWIQRQIPEYAEKSNEELLQDYDEKRKVNTLEEVELVINYNIVEDKNE